ncbi:hypothetical protein PtrSN002B_011364 [Pyrenophora tritici-repentis]|uniref:Uncharacterized protein n=2 Tax=Pyrenophora tritici-repentis TaxID=45151 RepID=A0A2W1D6G3_9PLEO|nr:uncharacterized protein PTRG_07182 [Pyrenophora tritici-repentis Pt-1C-BFP]KAA8614749.1 hypothetical protein PtrV1_11779 [Pyrenophora tritici-repentis]EDU50101.1 conserved hypothetical protein [Pyrenophora tritici-repentis Pt-1C-BFP]KAF7444574.1 hypothetical protein A1F99_111270 [Pyrenophora tritici-repentis]KAF7564767.1 hypothetical protein PtrM4_042010 [Pyrenophora tritici-repentis]KAG9378821.1 hypothetical protein A1F94_010590 [Pyrenophora tritici-repentis]
MGSHDTPPYSGPNTPGSHTSGPEEGTVGIATPNSFTATSPQPVSKVRAPSFLIPENLTQAVVEQNPQLKRLQLDLLNLTSFNDNSTLHWRPSWFKQDPFNKKSWTLHNPPAVVTEKIPSTHYAAKEYYTRRMRRSGDRQPLYIKDWSQWRRYCDMYGVPYDFLCEEQIELMRLGLPKNADGEITSPPISPLYPEPQPLGCGRYILHPETYSTHLPRKFHSVNHDAEELAKVEAVIVHSDGALKVEPRENMFIHDSQWTHYDGYGQYRDDELYFMDDRAPKQQGRSRRWSYLPWTNEQAESCSQVVKLKVNLKRKFANDSGAQNDAGGGNEGTERTKSRRIHRGVGELN